MLLVFYLFIVAVKEKLVSLPNVFIASANIFVESFLLRNRGFRFSRTSAVCVVLSTSNLHIQSSLCHSNTQYTNNDFFVFKDFSYQPVCASQVTLSVVIDIFLVVSSFLHSQISRESLAVARNTVTFWRASCGCLIIAVAPFVRSVSSYVCAIVLKSDFAFCCAASKHKRVRSGTKGHISPQLRGLFRFRAAVASKRFNTTKRIFFMAWQVLLFASYAMTNA